MKKFFLIKIPSPDNSENPLLFFFRTIKIVADSRKKLHVKLGLIE